jgi:hypothetical protein
MGTGYNRTDTINNIADGNIINASDFDAEYDAIEAAFNSSSGHTHDGTSSEGGPVTVLGPAQDFVASTTEIKPKSNNTLDIGTTGLKFKDMHLAGTANLVNLTTTGDVTLTGAANNVVFDASDNALEFADNAKATFGDAGDLEIYHDASHSRIVDAGTGSLAIQSNSLEVLNAAGTQTQATFVEAGAVELYHNNSKKFETTATGIAVTGSIALDGLHLDDNEKLTFGDSTTPDLELFHDTLNSYIRDNGTGDLKLMASQVQIVNAANDEFMAQFTQAGAVTLFHNNSAKFATDADGVNVTGQIDVSTDVNITGDLTVGDDVSLSSDGAIINIGAGGDVTLTHEHDKGIQAKAANGFELNLQTGDTSVESGNVLGKITFNAPDEAGGTDAILDGAAIEAVAEDTFASDNNTTALVFKTNTSGAATERMRIKGDGTIIMDTQVDIDNITINGNTISSTDTNGNIILATNGTGDIVINDDIISTTTNQDITLTPNGTGSVDISKLKIASGATAITSILDEDDLTSNSDTALATQQSVKAYVDAQISGGAFTGGITVSGGDIQLAHDNAVDFKDSTDTYRIALKKNADPTANHDIELPSLAGHVALLAAAATSTISATPTELSLMSGGSTTTSISLEATDNIVVNDGGTGGTMKQVALSKVSDFISAQGFSSDDPTALAIALG